MARMNPWKTLGALLVALSTLAMIGCAPKSPEEKVADLRARYSAELNSFIVRQAPVEPAAPVDAVADEPADESAPAADDAADGEEPVEPAEPEMRQDVMLDILVWHDANESLPGITLEVTMADGETELESWRVYVDTAGLPKANKRAVTHVLEGVDYVEGYGFNVGVRSPVPAAERGAYKEFSALDG